MTKITYTVSYRGVFSDFIERTFTSRERAQQWIRQVGVTSIATITESK